MVDVPTPFAADDEALFDESAEYVPEHLPEAGPFLSDTATTLLTGEAHVAVHEVARELFEARGVYDMTFGYNLARLNFDTRHPNAGYRYAEADDADVLRAEFTPTTPFCPQSHTLTVGSFRAWNGLADRHEYDLVRVRVHPMHHDAEGINRQLTELEETFRETGSIPDASAGQGRRAPSTATGERVGADDAGDDEAGYGPQAPF